MTHVIGTIASSRPVISGAFDSIATASGTGSSPTISFSSIPSTYRHLQIRAIARTTELSTGFAYLTMNFNGVSTSDYAQHKLIGDGSAASATGVGFQTSIEIGNCVKNSEPANILGVTIIDIHDYASTTKNKTVRSISGWDTNGSGRMMLLSGLFVNTTAITSITLQNSSGNFTTSSVFALYGIKGS